MSPTNVNTQKSSLDVMGNKVDVPFNSFIQRKLSEIHKILPRSPSKSVAILKHMWDQFYKSPRKHQYMHKYWKLDEKDMVKYMLKTGKHKACKDINYRNLLLTQNPSTNLCIRLLVTLLTHGLNSGDFCLLNVLQEENLNSLGN